MMVMMIIIIIMIVMPYYAFVKLKQSLDHSLKVLHPSTYPFLMLPKSSHELPSLHIPQLICI